MPLTKYIDDNETIYVSDNLAFEHLTVTSQKNLLIGLADLGAELSGQSTVFVNSVRFSFSGNIDPDISSDDYAYPYILCGVVPEGAYSTSSGPQTLDDYQEIKGFPLKGCFGHTNVMRPKVPTSMALDDWQGNYSYHSWTRTYRPKKSLVLSRLQQVIMNVTNYNNPGTLSDISGLMTIDMQLKRGD